MSDTADMFTQKPASPTEWLVRRLRDQVPQWGFEGKKGFDPPADLTPEQLREAIRVAIIDNGMAYVVAGRGKDGGTETYRQLFERIYGFPPEQRGPKESARA